MSAESGVPTYRGLGGIWHEYRWEDYACQNAFNNHPVGVLEFARSGRVSITKPMKEFASYLRELENIN